MYYKIEVTDNCIIYLANHVNERISLISKLLVICTQLSQSRTRAYGSTMISLNINMSRVSAKVVLSKCVTSHISGSFLFMIWLYLWPMLLLIVGWVIVILFSEVFLSSIYINYNASKIVQ